MIEHARSWLPRCETGGRLIGDMSSHYRGRNSAYFPSVSKLLASSDQSSMSEAAHAPWELDRSDHPDRSRAADSAQVTKGPRG